jgi:hypothetical protein
MSDRVAARAVARLVLIMALALVAFPARAATLDERDTSRLANINAAIQSFEDDIRSALHHLPRDDAEQIESYAYVELNLEAAHERLNNIFMLVAVSIFVESPSDELLVLNVMHGQLLQRSKNYLTAKKEAIASMAVAHPANKVFETYTARADAILGDRAIPLLEELYQRIAAVRR